MRAAFVTDNTKKIQASIQCVRLSRTQLRLELYLAVVELSKIAALSRRGCHILQGVAMPIPFSMIDKLVSEFGPDLEVNIPG